MRKCNKCGRPGLTDQDFYKTLKSICKNCHKAYMIQYTPQHNPNYRTYAQIVDLFKKACFRIREDELGLRLIPLRQNDKWIKTVIETKMKPGMTWAKYNSDWKLTYPTLMRMILAGHTKEELKDPTLLGVSWKIH